MSYIRINSEKSYNDAEKLIPFYEKNVVEVAKLLCRGEEDIPQGISLHFEIGVGAAYSRQKRRITYRIAANKSILSDMGRLIHEAAHVVQDYSFDSNRNRVTMCWTEGIADYCRAQLDTEFDVMKGKMGDPDLGYKEAACFLIWLSRLSPTVVVEINKLLAEHGQNINSHDQIFPKLRKIKKQYRDLKVEYFIERRGIQG